MALELNGVATFLYCVIPLWRWHFCFIKQHLFQSFSLRLWKCLKSTSKTNCKSVHSIIAGILDLGKMATLAWLIFSLFCKSGQLGLAQLGEFPARLLSQLRYITSTQWIAIARLFCDQNQSYINFYAYIFKLNTLILTPECTRKIDITLVLIIKRTCYTY